jgi:hypothetical protein
MRQKSDIAARQARVGIIANPAEVPLPPILPREMMTRWPDLRSRRRLRKIGQAQDLQGDRVLSGKALEGFKQEVRDVAGGAWLPRLTAFLRGRL